MEMGHANRALATARAVCNTDRRLGQRLACFHASPYFGTAYSRAPARLRLGRPRGVAPARGGARLHALPLFAAGALEEELAARFLAPAAVIGAGAALLEASSALLKAARFAVLAVLWSTMG